MVALRRRLRVDVFPAGKTCRTCSEHGTRVAARDAGYEIGEEDDTPSIFEHALTAPPWRAILPSGELGEEYVPRSPRDGGIATWVRARSEYREGRYVGSPGLWDHEQEALCAARNGDGRLLALRAAARARPTSVAPVKAPAGGGGRGAPRGGGRPLRLLKIG